MEELNIDERQQEQDILFGVINRFIGYFTRQAVPDTSNDTSREYPFVAMDTRQASEQIIFARNFLLRNGLYQTSPSFIDIGCGIGNILLLAEMTGFDVFGIEKDNASVTIAQNLLSEKQVSQEDIWTFKHLHTYDVVYYFRPFCEKTLQLRFEKFVEETIKPGAILIANRKMSEEINSDKRFLQLDAKLPLWYKIDTQNPQKPI